MIPREKVEALSASLRDQAKTHFVLSVCTDWPNAHHVRGVTYANAALQTERLLAGERFDGMFPPMDFNPIPELNCKRRARIMMKLIMLTSFIQQKLVEYFKRKCFDKETNGNNREGDTPTNS